MLETNLSSCSRSREMTEDPDQRTKHVLTTNGNEADIYSVPTLSTGCDISGVVGLLTLCQGRSDTAENHGGSAQWQMYFLQDAYI